MINDNAVSFAEKELARTAWEVEQILKYFFTHRLVTLKIIGDGRHCFNNSFARATKDRKWITSLQMADGLWEAMKHMLFGDRPDNQPWSNTDAKTMAFAELDAYDRASPIRHDYESWHDVLGSAVH